jgi:hypothetical protein
MPVEVLLAGSGSGAHQQRCGGQGEGKQALHKDGAFSQRVWGMPLGCIGESPYRVSIRTMPTTSPAMWTITVSPL